MSLVSCGGGSNSGSAGEFSEASRTCQSTDTQEGLNCILAGLQFDTVSLVKVPLFTTTGTQEADAPSIQSSEPSMTIDPSTSRQEIEFTWTDPQGQTPVFCMQLCNHSVCTSYNMCSRGIKDGKTTGTFRSTATWTAVPVNDSGTTEVNTRVTPIASSDGNDPIQFITSEGGYVIPGLNTVSTGTPDQPPPLNPPTKVIKQGAPGTVTKVVFNFPPPTTPPTLGGGTGGNAGSGGNISIGGNCVTVTNIPVCSGLQTCCDKSTCEYRWNGKIYPCNGTNCASAAIAVGSACTGL